MMWLTFRSVSRGREVKLKMNMCIAGMASRPTFESRARSALLHVEAAEVINTSAQRSLSSLNTFSLLAPSPSVRSSGKLRRGVIALRESKRPKHNLGRLSPQREGERVRAKMKMEQSSGSFIINKRIFHLGASISKVHKEPRYFC